MNKFVKSKLLLVHDILCHKKPCFVRDSLNNAEEGDKIYYCKTRASEGCPDGMAPPSAESFGLKMFRHKGYYKNIICLDKKCAKRVCFKPRKILLGYSQDGGNPFNTICETWFDSGCPDFEREKE